MSIRRKRRRSCLWTSPSAASLCVYSNSIIVVESRHCKSFTKGNRDREGRKGEKLLNFSCAYLSMENRESKELSQEDDPEEQEEDYASLVSGPYAHIFLENFRKGILESSATKKNNDQGSGVKKIEERQQQGRRIEVIEPPKHEPPPKPLPAENLKSAMKKTFTGKKGTWRKQKEKSANKWWRREVTWAPDVHDPTPSSDSHYKGPCPSSWGLNASEDKKTEGVDKEDDSERVKGYKNVNKKSGKNGVKGSGEGATETGMERHKSGNKKSLKNPQKGDGDGDGDGSGGGGAQGGAKGRKGKDKKKGGDGAGGIGGDRGGEGSDGKGKVKKSGKSKGTKA